MRKLLPLLLLAVMARGAAPGISGELIFPLEKWHNHSSSVVELPNGDLLVCWFHGSGERTADCGDDHREHQSGPRVLRRRGAGQDEDAGPDDGADAERGEVKGSECATQGRPTIFGQVQVGERLSGGEGHALMYAVRPDGRLRAA